MSLSLNVRNHGSVGITPSVQEIMPGEQQASCSTISNVLLFTLQRPRKSAPSITHAWNPPTCVVSLIKLTLEILKRHWVSLKALVSNYTFELTSSIHYFSDYPTHPVPSLSFNSRFVLSWEPQHVVSVYGLTIICVLPPQLKRKLLEKDYYTYFTF